MDNRQFGYVRVSSKDQNEARQISALLDFGISERDIYIDKQIGKENWFMIFLIYLLSLRKVIG